MNGYEIEKGERVHRNDAAESKIARQEKNRLPKRHRLTAKGLAQTAALVEAAPGHVARRRSVAAPGMRRFAPPVSRTLCKIVAGKFRIVLPDSRQPSMAGNF